MNEFVKVWRDKRVGRIQLDRPKALNALDLEMVRAIHAAIDAFRDDNAVQAVMVDAAGERAFCAGGDVRAIRQNGMQGDAAANHAFFAAEYAMNLAIAEFPKPYVALVNGICLGGGIGLSVHGSHRIATEKAGFAMPETNIALFPDVGTTYVLPRLPGAVGMYLALTGTRVTGADAVHAGFATHFVPAAKLAALALAIAEDGVAVIAGFAEALPPFSLAAHRSVIDTAFSAPSVTGIVTALQGQDSEFARATLTALRLMSPMALNWSLRIIADGAQRNLRECLAAELRLVRQVTSHPEFFEGVRAAVVDKDRSAKWRPATLEAVDGAAIEAFFA